MSKGNTFETDFLKLLFNGTTIANIADNAGTSPLTNLYFSLHTADPGEAGTQTTSECSYGGYARQAVARTSGGFTVASGVASPNADIVFPTATSGTQTAAYFAVGTVVSAAGKILYSGPLTPNISIVTGVTPRILASSTISED